MRVTLEFAEDGPAVAFGHDYVQCNYQRTHFPGQPQAFLCTGGGDGAETELGQEARHQIADSGIIINHENRIEFRFVLGRSRRSRAGSFRLRGLSRIQGDLGRQVYGERRALAWLALHADAALHHLHESMADGEPEAGSSVLARDRCIGLRELLKKFSLLFGADTDARIFDAKSNPLLSFHGALAYIQGDRSVIGELAGVAHQVE